MRGFPQPLERIYFKATSQLLPDGKLPADSQIFKALAPALQYALTCGVLAIGSGTSDKNISSDWLSSVL